MAQKPQVQEYKDKTDFPAVRCLQVNHCGLRRVISADINLLRSKGRSDYHLVYTKSGWFTAEVDGKEYVVDTGKCLVYPPRVRQRYTYSVEGAPVVYYMHFTGIGADEAMRDITPHKNYIYDIKDRAAFEGLFHQLLRFYKNSNPSFYSDIGGLLLQLIGILARSSKSEPVSHRSDILSITAYIREHYQEDISLEDLAGILNLSTSRFTHLFTEKVGVSPYKFLLQLRIDSAKELLRDTQMTVSEISNSVGFSDPSYFCRIFRRYTNSTPMDYRKKRAKPASG